MTPTRRDSLPVDEAWRKYDDVESRLTEAVSERMLDLAELRPGMRVIDLASGRGEPSLRAAQRVGPGGGVLGVDISEAVLAIGRERALHAGLSNLELRAADAESLDGVPAGSFDVATARWGLGYMRSPVSALAATRRVLGPRGGLVAAFWAEPERVPWATVTRRVLGRHRDVPPIDPEAPGAFRYADPSRIVRDFGAAGFTIEHVEEIEIPVIETETGAGIVAWVHDLGLVAKLASELPPDQRAAWEAELAREVEQFRVGEVVRLGGVTRVVVGRSTRS